MSKTPSKTTRRGMIAGAGALAATGAATGAAAQTPPAAAPPATAAAPSPTPSAPPRPKVVIDTAMGVITMQLISDKAPITCANFLRYVDSKRFDGQSFFRALKIAPTAQYPTLPLTGLVQGSSDNAVNKLYPPIAHESTLQTGLSNKDGAVSMARGAVGSATNSFFFCVGDLSSLDADPKQPGDNQGFAVFGQVLEGMDVVKAMLNSPISPTKGADWGMKGQILDPEIKIKTVRRA